MVIGNPITDPNDWLKPEIVDLILRKAWGHNRRNGLLIMMLLTTGRRIGELLDLKVKDISFAPENPMVLWNIEKKHKRLKDEDGEFAMYLGQDGKKHHYTEKVELRRWKAIDTQTLGLLKEYVQEEQLKPEDYVFYSPYKGKEYHMSRISVWIFLSKYAKELGIDVHPHTFRHTFSVWIAQNMKNPADLQKLSKLLEHSDIKITENYLQFSQEESRDLLEKTFNPEKKAS